MGRQQQQEEQEQRQQQVRPDASRLLCRAPEHLGGELSYPSPPPPPPPLPRPAGSSQSPLSRTRQHRVLVRVPAQLQRADRALRSASSGCAAAASTAAVTDARMLARLNGPAGDRAGGVDGSARDGRAARQAPSRQVARPWSRASCCRESCCRAAAAADCCCCCCCRCCCRCAALASSSSLSRRRSWRTYSAESASVACIASMSA